jgi:hypothetical protein
VANSSGVWTQARQSRNANQLAQWISGYLSGLNMETDYPDALLGTDYNGLMAWIDNYCRSNPLDKIVIAASRLFDELRSRAQPRQ